VRTGELVRLRSNRVPVVESTSVSLPERLGRWVVRAIRFVRRLGRRLRERFD